LEEGDDVGHGVESDGLDLADGADVAAVTGVPTTAASLAALGGGGGVVVEAVVGADTGVGLAGGTILIDGFTSSGSHNR
jgi:hypothetical protein